ncbi:AraC family transcriptional regulator [Ferrimonas sediminicola]|uniref:AraC family transcriptional regulator n=1 Tax=Ferrimonas sediminicola TaxID=2569538 RepID=A0A4U1BGX1_9GAMM|nr:AraC family transcriptional regulator [Ferrimonas sediminicola]TKB50485.1 AraC family transcriptional regulator [Ferrimonas sediminicola]
MNRVCIRQSEIEGVGLIDASYANFAFRRHYHLEYHVGLIVGGAQRYHCRGASHQAAPGHLVFMPPDQLHDGQAMDGRGYQAKVFTLGARWLNRSLDELTGQKELEFKQHQVRDPELFRGLVATHSFLGSRQPATLTRDCVSLEMLEQLVSRHGRVRLRRSPKLGRRNLDEIRDYMMAHLDQSIRLADLAALCGLTEAGLTRAFKETTGLPPYAWLTRLRLEKAMQGLRQGAGVTQVAQSVGFYDQAHFSRMFKQRFGATPGQICAYAKGGRADDRL